MSDVKILTCAISEDFESVVVKIGNQEDSIMLGIAYSEECTELVFLDDIEELNIKMIHEPYYKINSNIELINDLNWLRYGEYFIINNEIYTPDFKFIIDDGKIQLHVYDSILEVFWLDVGKYLVSRIELDKHVYFDVTKK